MGVRRTVRAPAGLRCASGLDMSKLQALETLNERGVIMDAKSLVLKVETPDFQHLETQGGRHFDDDVEKGVIAITPVEADQGVRWTPGVFEGGVLIEEEGDSVVEDSFFADALQDDLRTPAFRLLCFEAGDFSDFSECGISLLHCVKLHTYFAVRYGLDFCWSEPGVSERDVLTPGVQSVFVGVSR